MTKFYIFYYYNYINFIIFKLYHLIFPGISYCPPYLTLQLSTYSSETIYKNKFIIILFVLKKIYIQQIRVKVS